MIYFVQSVDGGPIKIGYTADLRARLKQLEAHYDQPLSVLATMNGDKRVEREIHRRFARYRFGRTEQFEPNAELLEFIGRPLLVSPKPVIQMRPKYRMIKLSREAYRTLRILAAYSDRKVSDLLDEIVINELGPALRAMRDDEIRKRLPQLGG